MNHPPTQYALLDLSNGDIYLLDGAKDFGDAYLACSDAYAGRMDSQLFEDMICLPRPGARLRPIVYHPAGDEVERSPIMERPAIRRADLPQRMNTAGIFAGLAITVLLAGSGWLAWWVIWEVLRWYQRYQLVGY